MSPVPRSGPAANADPLPPDRPNIVLLVSDDQQMATFTRALMPSAVLAVGRPRDPIRSVLRQLIALLLVAARDNDRPHRAAHRRRRQQRPVEPPDDRRGHDLGDGTMLAGKYLNSLPCDPRPEFDRWVCQFQNGDNGFSLVDPTLNVDGTETTFTGYTTQIEANFASQFIRSTPHDQPFFVMYTPTSRTFRRTIPATRPCRFRRTGRRTSTRTRRRTASRSMWRIQ